MMHRILLQRSMGNLRESGSGRAYLKLENMPVGNKAINITYKVVPYQQSYTFAFSKVVLHEAVSYLKKSERIPIRMTFDYIKPFWH